MLSNIIRGCLGEFGIVAPVGIRRVAELIAVINDDADTRILPEARIAMRAVADQLCDLQKRIKEIEQAIRAWHRGNEASRRLATIPGVGSITASAIVATVANACGAQYRTIAYTTHKSGEYRRIRGRTYCPGAAIRASIWGIPSYSLERRRRKRQLAGASRLLCGSPQTRVDRPA